jgi:Na+/H+-dicarboxylate symporter/ABC-type amino acid transport substrate-binding protein
MSFSRKILIALAAGILLGIFLGERATYLKWAADGFVKLLQMTVLPYVVVSIIGSLATLNAADAKRLAVKAGAVLLLLWAIALVFAFLIPLTFPSIESASFFSTTLVERRQAFNFVDLYIPSNPFYSLANNIVPAVVLFSIVVGVALIGVERKTTLVEVLRTASEALARATRFIVRLTPYGLFAIAAVAAGTLNLEQIGRLQVYLIAYVAVALLVSLWVLPGLIAAVTPIRIREIFELTRNALIVGFVAGDLFIILPVLTEASKTLIARHGLAEGPSGQLPDVVVPASFNFPHTGKLLSLSFILFAAWFTDIALTVADRARLAFTGLVTFFGSLNSAVPFLLDLFRIPADTFQLFLATGVINSRVGTLVAAVHTLTVALLGSCAVVGAVNWRSPRLPRYLAVTLALTVVVIGGTRLLFERVLRHEYTRDEVLAGMHLLLQPSGDARVYRTELPSNRVEAAVNQLSVIRSRGALRVGYAPNSLPYAFFNSRGDLVGFDVEMAHRLAEELRVGIEFVPVDRPRVFGQLSGDYCDIVMSGVPVTTDNASRLLLSASYLDETLAFVVPDHAREAFASWDQIHRMGPIVIGAPDVPYYIDKVRQQAPEARIEVLRSPEEAFALGSGLHAMLLPAERGSAWTLLHPEFSVVVPEPGLVKVPLAYAIARHDQTFASFVNTWIDLKRKDGTIDRLYRYWILGQNAAAARPRWSIIRDVLHWVD